MCHSTMILFLLKGNFPPLAPRPTSAELVPVLSDRAADMSPALAPLQIHTPPLFTCKQNALDGKNSKRIFWVSARSLRAGLFS